MLTPIIVAAVCLTSGTVWAAYEKPTYQLENAENLYKDFVKQHNKIYDQKEYSERLAIFKETLKDINERNTKFPDAVFAVNQFADLKPQELQQYYGFKLPNKNITEGVLEGLQASLSDDASFDWRENNAVTPVKNQGTCAASYIFSTVGNIEGQYAIKNKQCLAFSEAQLLDCLDHGTCNGYGTDMEELLDELVQEKTKLEKAEDYPFEPRKRKCRAAGNGVVQVTNAEVIMLQDEEKIREKLKLYGPLSIALDGSDFFHYKGGILQPKTCSAGLNLAVLLVGYGEENGKKFWIIKNSWGTGWGEEGYVRMQRGVRACGIGAYIALSTVA